MIHRVFSVTLGTLLVAASVFTLSEAGIIRHDVPMEEYLQFAQEPRFDCVGRVFVGDEGGSAVLVAGKYALTAAHVLVISDFKLDTVMIDGKEFIANQPYNDRFAEPAQVVLEFAGKKYQAVRIVTHPSYSPQGVEGETDLAIVELAQTVDGVEPAALGRSFDELGRVVAGCGFGWSGLANKPEEQNEPGLKIAGQNTIDSVGGYKAGTGEWAVIYSDFDHPEMPDSCNQIGSAKALPLEYTPTGGDSGGGLFTREGKDWKLIGITTGAGVSVERLLKYGYYSQLAGWTRVSVFHTWIRSAMK